MYPTDETAPAECDNRVAKRVVSFPHPVDATPRELRRFQLVMTALAVLGPRTTEQVADAAVETYSSAAVALVRLLDAGAVQVIDGRWTLS